MKVPAINITSQDSNLDTEEELPSSPEIKGCTPLCGEFTSSATDWMGVTTNSEDCSYSSDLDNISDNNVEKDDYSIYDNEFAPTGILNPPFGKGKIGICVEIGCGNELKRQIRIALH